MSLFDELGISDPTAVNMKEQEEKLAAGGLAPKGVHHAILEGARIITIEGVKRGYELKFRIIAGPGKDSTAEDAIWLPKGDDAGKDNKLKARGLMYGKRLGLLTTTKTPSGIEIPAMATGKNDYCDCLGVAVFIDVVHEVETYEKDGKERTITKAKLAYEGVLKTDDKKVTNIPKATTTQTAAAVAARPFQQPVDNLADL